MEQWIASGGWAHSTIRSYEGALAAFLGYLEIRGTGVDQCEQQAGVRPVQVCHDGNMAVHAAGYEGRPEPRPLTRAELQSFLDAADDHVERAASSRRKGWLASFRDATLFKVVYGWGLRRRETAMLDVDDFTANPAAPELAAGRVPCPVRQGDAGQPAAAAAVATVMPWTAEALAEYIEEVRPSYETAARQAALWLTERGGRISPRQVDDRFAQWRAAAGLPPSCPSTACVTGILAPDRGRRGPAVRPAAGRAFMGIHHCRLHDGRAGREDRMLRAALARAFEGEDTMARTPGYRWHLRRLMAEKDMYATTQLVPLLAQRGSICPASRYTGWSPACQNGWPGHPGGTVRHSGLPAGQPDRDRHRAAPRQAGPASAVQLPGPVRARVAPGQGGGR